VFLSISWGLSKADVMAQEKPVGEPPTVFPPSYPSLDAAPGRPVVLGIDPTSAETTDGPAPNRNYQQKVEGALGLLSSKLVVQDPGTDYTLPPGKWQAENAVQVSLTGPLHVFGQFGANCDSVVNQDLKLAGKTGLGCKLPKLAGVEMLIRGGTSMSMADPQRPERMKEQSGLLFELQCRCPLPGKLRLEYDSTAVPALDPTEHDRLMQDVRVAVPLGSLGEFRLGAKHNWENLPIQRPWTEGMQLYLGVDLKR
jgi:hypothetical protein